MESKICMNVSCGMTMTHTWRRGWPLRSGGFADLCDECGSAYEKSVFCNTFHAEEPGWRECLLCSKRLHCGCVASMFLLELLDYGGVECVDCARSSGLDTVSTTRIRKDTMYGKFITPRGHISDLPSSLELRKDGTAVSRPKLTPCRKLKVVCDPSISPLPKKILGNGHLGRIKSEEKFDSYREVCRDFTDQAQISVGSSNFTKRESTPRPLAIQETCTDPPLLSLPWNAPMWSSTFVSPVTDYVPDERDVKKPPVLSSLDHGPNPANSVIHCLPTVPDSSKALALQSRVARPPAEGRGRNQLLPRYWPRITDQELQQLSGDLKLSIVPLFEKVLSASDAGRIGRLVLPKACAEAYFPPISQSEGLPLKIQDIKGKEWTFQFRFWPNNNSRMYVLEGVTPCIQSMQLQAGDTVTFSRINPGGKLVMGFRKAASYANTQDGQASVGPTSDLSGDSSFPLDMDDMAHQMGCGIINPSKVEKSGGSASKKTLPNPLTNREKKSRNISSKNKRLLMRSEESADIRVTWEEAQDLLRPPPSATPSIVVIEDQEFEEYDEPPVFGKRTVFIFGSSGQQEQWAQCDNCSKWRRIPMDVLLPPKWTCLENVWDPKRSSCSAPERIRRKDAQSGRDKKKLKAAEFPKISEEQEASGLDALASVAVLGENAENCGDPCIGTTTKHPRHRSGCSCIVCIQPPSGQGKHEPSCTCNVCTTVKRRFKTLMMRRKIRQSEREAEAPDTRPEEIELEMNTIRAEHCHGRAEIALPSAAAIDLNCDPSREDHARSQESMDADMEGGSMMGFVHASSLPLHMYMKQNGFTSLMHEQQEAVEALFLRAETHASAPSVIQEFHTRD